MPWDENLEIQYPNRNRSSSVTGCTLLEGLHREALILWRNTRSNLSHRVE